MKNEKSTIGEQVELLNTKPSKWTRFSWALFSLAVNLVIGLALLFGSFSFTGPDNGSTNAMVFFVFMNLVVLMYLVVTKEREVAIGFGIGATIPVTAAVILIAFIIP